MGNNMCKLCDRFVITEDVIFEDGKLILVVPDGCYCDANKYCIVIAQNIPDETTIKSEVFIRMSSSKELYPVVYRSCCCSVTACTMRTRKRYAMQVCTNKNGGVFKLLGKTFCDNPSKEKPKFLNSSTKKKNKKEDE